MYNLTAEASYPTPYATSQFLSLILLSMAGQKHTPDTTTEIENAYDYVIVGGGSAGSVVASRLAEKNCVTVLLLEAGKSPPKLSDIPAIARNFIRTDIDWNYHTAPQEYTGAGLVNRSVAWPSGKTIGGSSVINAMLNLRGNKENYDDWAEQGATGWNYDEVLPYFMKLETNTNAEYVSNGYHGTSGPVTVSKPPYCSELKRAVLETGRKLGYDVGDINGPRQRGIYDLQGTIRNGQRCSAAKAYLVPKDYKDNLDIVPQAFVKKIVINNQKACGVVFDFQGKQREVKALREVILSAGTINTAQLLMLSGIGPREELRKHNIPVKADLPVGKNLQDHCGAIIAFELNNTIRTFEKKLTDEDNIKTYINSNLGFLTAPYKPNNAEEYWDEQANEEVDLRYNSAFEEKFSNWDIDSDEDVPNNPLTSVQGVNSMAFLDRDGIDAPGDFPDHQLYFWEGAISSIKEQMRIKPEYFKAYFGPYEKKPFYMCLSQILQPKATGQVTLRSNNPYDPPIIDPKYFSHPDDLEVVVEGLKKCKKFCLSGPMKKIGSKMFTTSYPGCKKFINNEDEYFRCNAKSVIMTLNHQVGTAKMGNPRDPSTVLDPQLRVKGISNLRVVDASVMPSIPSGNTNVPTMMVAEKASDLIKQNIHCYLQD